MVRRGLLGALFPFLIAGAAGCGSSSPTAPVADPTVVSDTFTGTINPLGTDSHTFTVGYAGGTSNASVTVVALATVANQTPQTITIGVGFGSLNQGGTHHSRRGRRRGAGDDLVAVSRRRVLRAGLR
jgi:hypothetical protein